MKVAFISPWFSEGMGYSENMFPKALARLGVDVHLVTSTAQINYYLPHYDKTYKSFLGPKIVDPVVKELDGYTLHRLPYYDTKKIYEGPGITGLYEYLEKLGPDVLQTFEIKLETSYESARYAQDHDRRFFTECHMHASVLWPPPRKRWKEQLKNWRNAFNGRLRYINKVSRLCYPIAEDVVEIAVDHYRVPGNKIKMQSLGVDTYAFTPASSPTESESREKIRREFGFSADDIVCIYTGRFTADKNPQCLAMAIDHLNAQGLPFKGLFIGNGPEKDVEFIREKRGCRVGAFVPARDLPIYYRASDIGVWPREESTSQLDAAACGLPLILSDRIKVTERVNGNGLLYAEGDHLDLAEKLIRLQDAGKRKSMSAHGVQKVRANFSWEKIARDRLADYLEFLK
ncbi:MAG TPA: glycosyltransferase family 4 protein [Puia sp.]|jgi:glycosyltransferase involved in cell wall biosynthesis|nr:glycosyltransferase family 4 protein [Puia sp.]